MKLVRTDVKSFRLTEEALSILRSVPNGSEFVNGLIVNSKAVHPDRRILERYTIEELKQLTLAYRLKTMATRHALQLRKLRYSEPTRERILTEKLEQEKTKVDQLRTQTEVKAFYCKVCNSFEKPTIQIKDGIQIRICSKCETPDERDADNYFHRETRRVKR